MAWSLHSVILDDYFHMPRDEDSAKELAKKFHKPDIEIIEIEV